LPEPAPRSGLVEVPAQAAPRRNWPMRRQTDNKPMQRLFDRVPVFGRLLPAPPARENRSRLRFFSRSERNASYSGTSVSRTRELRHALLPVLPTPICLLTTAGGHSDGARIAERLYQCGLGYNVAGAGSANRDYPRGQPPGSSCGPGNVAHGATSGHSVDRR